MKTIVEAAHEGRHINGFGGCHTRWAHNGLCSGHSVAAWLNSLGEDEETYITLAGKVVTNGDIRHNWLTVEEHVRAATVLNVDLSQIELRILAHMGDSK